MATPSCTWSLEAFGQVGPVVPVVSAIGMEEKEWKRKVRTCVQFLFWLHKRHLARSAWYFQLSDGAIGIDKRKREKMTLFLFYEIWSQLQYE